VVLSLQSTMRHDLGILYKSGGITSGVFLTPISVYIELYPQSPHHYARQVSVQVLQHDGPPTNIMWLQP